MIFQDRKNLEDTLELHFYDTKEENFKNVKGLQTALSLVKGKKLIGCEGTSKSAEWFKALIEQRNQHKETYKEPKMMVVFMKILGD